MGIFTEPHEAMSYKKQIDIASKVGELLVEMTGKTLSKDEQDDMFKDAVRVVVESGKASASLLQRRLRDGYARAARLMEEMEEQGIIGPADGARPRDVLVSSLDDVFGSAGAGAGDDEEQLG